VRGSRGDELAASYRKIADLQAALADAEARHEQLRAASASADEMVGQMLARVSEVEARLRGALADLAQADARAAAAEGRADLGAREHQDARDAAAHAASASRAEVEALRARLLREQVERETLHQRVIEFTQVCEERDSALLREELMGAELDAVRDELAEAKLQARVLPPGPGFEGRASTGEVRGELMSARESALRASEQLRLALEGMGRALVDLDALGAPQPPEVEGAAAAPLVSDAEDDEPTQTFGKMARQMASGLGSRRD